uniref:Putative nicotinic acetylcholine receptor 4 n=1 Tax=Hirudo verbana TaxID=311461 RepID=A0A2S1WM36_9ANNE|nr:putative nicotinic acetylcholine receptor 4 [Hirudo verbana]
MAFEVFKAMKTSSCSFVWIVLLNYIDASTHSKRLYQDILNSASYNKLIRPVGQNSDTLVVKVGLRLTSIIDIDEKNQIMTTNVWLEQEWYDYKLKWNPENYGNVRKLYVPPDAIWLPDIVLYNSADGNFTVKIMTKATVHHDGLVTWSPPAIYKSLCLINVEYFPFDEQTCTLKIGSWSYDGYSVDIKHNLLKDGDNDLQEIEEGINLTDYAASIEWDLLAVPAKKYLKYYPCCSEPFPDIKFNITIRRKTLYHTVNLILPCVAICALTLLVFFVPAYSGEKITMAITILNSLNIFLLLVAEINPPTSLATPLIGKYLLFIMVLVTCSIIVTVFVLNVHFRSPSTHVMSPCIRQLFLEVLPRLLFMQRPQDKKQELQRKLGFTGSIRSVNQDSNILIDSTKILAGQEAKTRPSETEAPVGLNASNIHHAPQSYPLLNDEENDDYEEEDDIEQEVWRQQDTRRRNDSQLKCALPPTLMQAVIGVNFIAEHIREQDESDKVKEDWQFISTVMDRLFMWMFTAVCFVGTLSIIIQAPTLYVNRTPIGL